MANTIAFAGKGGTGKTTLSGLLIDYLGKSGKGPVLAVDADANSNLNEVLGVPIEATLGAVREEIASSEIAAVSPIPTGMSKHDYLEMRVADALIEEDDYDLLVMGRTQGKGCYCYVNSLLQSRIQSLSGGYKYIVVDNEAGLEHISRGLLPKIDVMLLVSDCSRRGIQAAARISELIDEMEIKHGAVKLIVNRAPEGKLNPGVLEEITLHNLDLLGVIPQDNYVYEFDSEGKPTVTLPDDSQARVAFESIIEKALICSN